MGVVLIKGAWPNIFAHILHVDVLVHYFMKMKGVSRDGGTKKKYTHKSSIRK